MDRPETGRHRKLSAPSLVLSDLTMNAIQAEATRAYLRHGPASMLNGQADDRGQDRRFRVLAEEVGEVAKELNDAEVERRPVDRDSLERELIQVAAMAASWIEALNTGEGR